MRSTRSPDQQVPIWVANFVLGEYGTGARDGRARARRARLRVRAQVPLAGPCGRASGRRRRRRSGRRSTAAVSNDGVLVNSGPWDGMPSDAARATLTGEARARGIGEGTVQFRLKDWGISRQRYWGTPIPMSLLREGRRRAGAGRSAAGRAAERHGIHRARRLAAGAGAGVRERDVSRSATVRPGARPTRWTRSSTRRGTSTASATRRTTTRPFDPAKARYWMPVDFYSGGVEHAILHLIYSRFFTRVFRDLGMVEHERAVHAAAHAGHGAQRRQGHVEVEGQRRRSGPHAPAVRRRRPPALRDVRRAARERGRVDRHWPRGQLPLPRARLAARRPLVREPFAG